MENIDCLKRELPEKYTASLKTYAEQSKTNTEARKDQKVVDGIKVQMQAVKISPEQWKAVYDGLLERKLLTPKEMGIIEHAMNPAKIPSSRQSAILLKVLDRARSEGLLKS